MERGKYYVGEYSDGVYIIRYGGIGNLCPYIFKGAYYGRRGSFDNNSFKLIREATYLEKLWLCRCIAEDRIVEKQKLEFIYRKIYQ